MLTPREAFITLNLIPGLGSVRIRSLLDHFGSAELVLAAPQNMLVRVPRIGPALAAAIADWRNCTNVQAELDYTAQYGCRIVTLLDEDYPAALRQMDDPPVILYVKGELRDDDFRRAVSVVGTRRATPYGMTTARTMARELADAGHTIISGLARGIDTAAHWGALDAGGRTVAVLGFGLAEFYPPENAELADCICNGHGALVSEFPMYLRPSQNTFPQRNRIVAAWGEATLVAEAPSRSGALHTAGMAAANYGRMVFAVPGSIQSPASSGCHDLIRDGATLCTSAQQLISDMHWDAPQQLELFAEDTPAPQPVADDLYAPGSEEAKTLAAIRQGHDTLDALCSALGMGAHTLTPLLMRLQIQGSVRPTEGGRFICR